MRVYIRRTRHCAFPPLRGSRFATFKRFLAIVRGKCNDLKRFHSPVFYQATCSFRVGWQRPSGVHSVLGSRSTCQRTGNNLAPLNIACDMKEG